MASCPNCQTELPDDFGLLECSGCKASVFVDMDGNVIQGSASSSSAEGSSDVSGAMEMHSEASLEPAQETAPENWEVNSSEQAFAEVAEFGNQDNIYQNEGPLSYIVTLSGIDSKELENRIKEVLEDKRLVLDLEQLMPTLKNGQLRLTGLSPVKTYVLVSKIYDLPISIEWEQHVLSE